MAETGAVDRGVWNSIQSVYYNILASLDYKFEEGGTLPYPGRVLVLGSSGDDVRALQEYLNFISNTYTEIPKVTVDGVYGPGTAAAVAAFVKLFELPGNPERVSAQDWNAIVSVYEDLYSGSNVNRGQYPGYDISAGG